MAGPLPVKGTEISSAPCSVQRAAGLLRRFLSSEAGAEAGIAKGYIEAVAQSLEEMVARRRESSGNGAEELRVAPAGRSSKFFNVEHVQKVPEVKKRKSRKEKEAKESKHKEMKELKQKKKDKAMFDFEALLGHELDSAEPGEQANGELGFEEKFAVTEMLPSTPRQVDSVDDGRDSQKSEKRKKKRKSLVGGAMDVDMDGMQSTRTAEAVVVDSDPDITKSAKKKKKRKSVDGLVSNGLTSSLDTPAKAIKVEEGVARTEDEDMKPANDGRKKKKKHGSTPMKDDSKELSRRSTSKSVL
ncbi:hypothetical protein M758_1G279300 [Ceratodon purpureus]|uniref:Uncharacterized protein n=1 Tax=Ceratodon purpureus TaxID=3225 RepID=A0A8T0JAW3_CERPU|nr:hypothetical protein KC19_1G287900 [Ceratodon purpureus]KAG0631792.1 hypothetical protein M758_1G279300 [Ceratodon purpureus]